MIKVMTLTTTMTSAVMIKMMTMTITMTLVIAQAMMITLHAVTCSNHESDGENNDDDDKDDDHCKINNKDNLNDNDAKMIL